MASTNRAPKAIYSQNTNIEPRIVNHDAHVRSFFGGLAVAGEGFTVHKWMAS